MGGAASVSERCDGSSSPPCRRAGTRSGSQGRGAGPPFAVTPAGGQDREPWAAAGSARLGRPPALGRMCPAAAASTFVGAVVCHVGATGRWAPRRLCPYKIVPPQAPPAAGSVPAGSTPTGSAPQAPPRQEVAGGHRGDEVSCHVLNTIPRSSLVKALLSCEELFCMDFTVVSSV